MDKTNKKAYDLVKKINQEKYENHSKKKLISNIEKKFKTTMIGALARFEDEFGYLWGLGSDQPLTGSQKEWYEKWQFVRTEILNNGNNQLRACLDEIAQYTMTYNQYHTQFIVQGDKNEKV